MLGRMIELEPPDAQEMLFRVRVARMADGERLPLVVGPDALPMPIPNQWVLFMRRPQVQANTLIEELRTVAHVYDWATRRGIDLDARLASGSGLQPVEISALYQNLRYVRPFGRESAVRRLSTVQHAQVVAGKTHGVRVGVAREYLVWGLERTLYRLDVADPRVPEVRERCERIRRAAIDFQRPTSDGRAKRIGLNADQRTRLLKIIHPEYVGNPFARPVRFRNWVLILLMLTFGFRRGEILKFYVSDVNVKGRRPSLTVHRRPGDISDTRANEPAVKTFGREVPLSPEAAKLLNVYIQHHRPRFPNVDASPFLFFSEDGKPLSLRMVNAIMEQIIRRFPEFADKMSPHVLRYTYNDMLIESARTAGMDGESLKAAQNYLNGWSLDSEQGALYSRRATEELAREISMAHQRSLFQ
jgi:integrase